MHIRFNEPKRVLLNLEDEEPHKTNLKKEIFVQWITPPEGWYGLNSNGAAKGSPGPVSGGAVIRDHLSTFVSAISANFGICSAFKAEI